jgi:hypothetical protein
MSRGGPSTSNAGAATRQQPDGGHIYGICKYYRQGTCTLGDGCRYSHIDENPGEGHTGVFGQIRKPLLQVVVLFASDTRVFNYARSVVQRFLDVGIDVYLHVSIVDCGGAAVSTGCWPSPSAACV